MNQEDLINNPDYRPNVGIMIVNDRQQILAGEAYHYPGEWMMPQGGIDSGETPYQAMQRELVEETGIALSTAELLREHSEWLSYRLGRPLEKDGGTYIGQRQKWFLLNYHGVVPDPESVEIKEFSQFDWVQPDWLIENTTIFKQTLYQQIIAEFKCFFP